MKKKELPEISKVSDEVIENTKTFDPEIDEITKIEHFEIYNKWARKNKRPVKVPTEDFYPKVKVKFQRFDQPDNVLKATVRKKHIEWTGQLKPGFTYELCVPVIQYLNSLSVPIYAEVRVNDGSATKSETKQVGERARFSCQQEFEFQAA